MKKIFLAGAAATLFLGSCGEGNGSDSEALNNALTDVEAFDAAVESFGEGGATNGEEYFSGVLAEVVEVDVKYKEVARLDEKDASEEKITEVIDKGVQMIADARTALDLYKDKNWPKRQQLHDLTLEWFASMEGLMKNYLYDLAEPMSRPDDTWTDEDFDFYDEYVVAVEEYYEVDTRWVEFQYEYAAANGFQLSEDNTIDEDALVDQEIGE